MLPLEGGGKLFVCLFYGVTGNTRQAHELNARYLACLFAGPLPWLPVRAG